MADGLLNATSAAAFLGLAKQTLAAKRVSGSGPKYVKFGRRVMYSMLALQAYVESCTRTHTAEDSCRAHAV